MSHCSVGGKQGLLAGQLSMALTNTHEIRRGDWWDTCSRRLLSTVAWVTTLELHRGMTSQIVASVGAQFLNSEWPESQRTEDRSRSFQKHGLHGLTGFAKVPPLIGSMASWQHQLRINIAPFGRCSIQTRGRNLGYGGKPFTKWPVSFLRDYT